MLSFPRQREEEWMDRPGADAGELSRSLEYIRRVNRWLRYTQATLSHLARFSARWDSNKQIRIIDIATGSADVPVAIARWAQEGSINVHITGIDLHGVTSEHARKETAPFDNIRIVRADAMSLPFEHRSFDYALCSMFLHHLSEDEVIRVLREMDRVASRGVIVADLLRHRRALAWITLFTAFSGPMVRHDARVSVRQAFEENEIKALRDRADLSYAKFHRHFAHRFVLAGER